MTIWTVLCLILIGMLLSFLGAAGWYLYKFSKIIMVFEDDIGNALDTMVRVDDGLANLSEMMGKQVFFSDEVQQIFDVVSEEAKMCRFFIMSMAQRFTERSKRRYVTVWDNETNTPVYSANSNPPQVDVVTDWDIPTRGPRGVAHVGRR
jgi:hypothetical protein